MLRLSCQLRLASLPVACLTILLSGTPASAQIDKRSAGQRHFDVDLATRSRFSLLSDVTAVLLVNEFQCSISYHGKVCQNFFTSPYSEGGFWPTGSPNGYIFEAGLQIAGLVPSNAGFAWAGDTVGAYFFDERGVQEPGEGITNIYNSLDPEDLQSWPVVGKVPDFPNASAYISDPEIFNPTLLNKKAVSEQDTWVLYWDGNPAFDSYREHPMGVLVEQRTLAWNYPEGNEATIFFIFKLTNVTNNRLFQELNEEAYFEGRDDLPDSGWRIDSIYAAFTIDPDVGFRGFDENHGTAILPLDLALAYDGDFQENERYEYSPEHFYPPFFPRSPGLVGVEFLKTPTSAATGQPARLTMFSQWDNPSSPDAGQGIVSPLGTPQLWRYLSGNFEHPRYDGPCTFPDPKERRLCYLRQEVADVWFFQSTGPFSLEPGESETIVVGIFAAATVETDQIILGDATANPPGIPSPRPGCEEPLRPIEVAAGWISTPSTACGASGDDVDPSQIQYVPGSLVGKALVAQAMMDAKFALPAPPEPPEFYLTPGDGRVTVSWEPSPTEEVGDPFYDLAGDPASPLYNPNYRRNDVEGYRIFKGRRPDDLQLIAQFDKRDTRFVDQICETDPYYLPGAACDTTVERDIAWPFVQYPIGGIVDLDGYPFILKADTALAAAIRDSTAFHMDNSGVPLAFVDTAVDNGFQYYYKVTAFDINSLRSGPSSLESYGRVKGTVPQVPAADLRPAEYRVALLGRGDGPLESEPPRLDPDRGTFSGPAAPTEQLFGDFAPVDPLLLPQGTYEVRIDSVVPLYYSGQYYLTVAGEPTVVGSAEQGGFGNACDPIACEFDLPPLDVPSDPSVRRRLQNAGSEAPPAAGRLSAGLGAELLHWHSADSDWAYTVPGFWSIDPPSPDALDGGSRWFVGENETRADPTLDLEHGSLPGVQEIFQPVPFQGILAPPELACDAAANAFHMRRFFQTTWLARRAADIKIYWAASSRVDSVIDATHDLPVPFSPAIRGSYGFLNTDADGNGAIDYVDFWHLDGLQQTPAIGCASSGPDVAFLETQPVKQPVDATGDRIADGDGFAMYIGGEPYIFLTNALPSNTVWTLRSYNGVVTRASGEYTFEETPRTPGVTGLRFALTIDAAATIEPAEADLAEIHTVPDPYYGASRYDQSAALRRLLFVNLPARATIRIYSLGGVLVDVINHDDPSGGGQAEWDLRNRGNEPVASGVYFFHVTSLDGRSHIGKFTIINGPEL